MKSLIKFLLPLLLAACGSEMELPAADTVFINGKVLTVDSEFSVAEALAIEGSRIVAVGDTETLSQRIGAATQVVELQGKTVIPGLIDNHMHFIRAAQRWNLQARIDGVNSRSEALEIIAAAPCL